MFYRIESRTKFGTQSTQGKGLKGFVKNLSRHWFSGRLRHTRFRLWR